MSFPSPSKVPLFPAEESREVTRTMTLEGIQKAMRGKSSCFIRNYSVYMPMQRALRSKSTFIRNAACVQCCTNEKLWVVLAASSTFEKSISIYLLNRRHWEGETKNEHQKIRWGVFHIMYVENAVHQSSRQSVFSLDIWLIHSSRA